MGLAFRDAGAGDRHAVAADPRVGRADLLMTGMIFPGMADIDILFNYGIFTPECRRAALAEMRRLQMNVNSRTPHLSSDRLFPDWSTIFAKLCEAADVIWCCSRNWMLTAKFNDYPDGWVALFEEAGYTCDYYWTIVE